LNKADEQINYRKIIASALVTVLVMSILLYAPSPLVVIEPGIAISTKPIVQYSHEKPPKAYDEREGEFILTAIKLVTPNILNSLISAFHPQYSVLWKADIFGKDTVDQYMKRSMQVMKASHDDALEAAYRYLQIDYSIQPQALYVTDVKKNSIGIRGSEFQAGDQILEFLDGTPIESVEQLARKLADGDIPDQLSVKVQASDGSIRIIEEQSIEGWQESDDPTDKLASLLGITGFTEWRAVKASEDRFNLVIDSKSIGGPSAGLILALTMIDALTNDDLTKGQVIAATGSIAADGSVGMIGGISQKVYSTSKRGAKLFIVPKGNEKEAREKAKRLRTKMDIVGVSTLSEAMEVIERYE